MSTLTPSGHDQALNLCAGEWVEVKSAKEILATLDDAQCLAGLPFMPEMLQYCGRRFKVYKTAHKTCDTINEFVIRRMSNAVHLEGLRCDGGAHGGCQTGCLLFFKEAWLKRVPGPQASSTPQVRSDNVDLDRLFRATQDPVIADEPKRYRCQATELLNATTEVRGRERWNPAFYFRDLTSGNVRIHEFVLFGLLAAFNSLLRRFGWQYPALRGLAGDKTPAASLNLQPGELVQLRSKAEIMKTLNANMRNRGLSFDVEMVPFCEKGTYRVLTRVERVINEKTGHMIEVANPSVILDNVTCSGHHSKYRMFCQRNCYLFLREIWLTRAGTPINEESAL